MSLPDLQEPLALLEQKDVDTAIDVLEQKVTVLPAHLGAHVLLAYAYEAQQRWDEALESWENARFLMPNSPIAEAGKRRVLRRMDGIETDDGPLGPGAPPRPATAPARPAESASSPASEDDEAEADTDREEESPAEDDELAQLRRQAEREARQGGARAGFADEPPSVDPPPPPETPSSTPKEQIEQLENEEGSNDLDRLIDKLQSARIDPDPDAEADAPPPEPDFEDETEEVVSETLARIHKGQEDYQKAARIYETLADQEPDRAAEFREKAAEMRAKADDAENAARE